MKQASQTTGIRILMTLFVMISGILIIQTNSFAKDDYEDVVYLKNGSIIRGMILEQVPNVSLKIETYDGSIFVFKIEDVEKITKERVKKAKKSSDFEEPSDEPTERVKQTPEYDEFSTQPTKSKSYKLSKFVITANPGGVILNGPMMQFDMRIADNFYLGASARFGYLGVINQYDSIYTYNGQYETRRLERENAAFGFSLKFLPGKSKNRFYIGLPAEFGLTEEQAKFYKNGIYENGLSHTNASFNPILNAGYRLRFSRVILNLGLYEGLLIDKHGTYLRTMLDISVGFEF